MAEVPAPGVGSALPRRQAMRCGLGLLLLPLVGCAQGSATNGSVAPSTTFTNVFEQERRRGVQLLLDQWARAQRANNTEALSALVDARAAPGFLASELRKAENLQAAPLAEWGYDIGGGQEHPVPPEIAHRLDATDVWAPPVRLRYRFEGESAATHRDVALIVARWGTAWSLVSDGEIDDATRWTWRGPWEFGQLAVARGPNGSTVLGHPDRAAMVSGLATALPDAVDRVVEFWGGQWSQQAVVFVASSPDEFVGLSGVKYSADLEARSELAAVAVADDPDDGGAVGGQRIVVNSTVLARLAPEISTTVLVHELFHVAARQQTVDGSAMWVVEGVADYVGRRAAGLTVAEGAPTVAALIVTMGPPNALPQDRDFRAGGQATTIAYELAWTVAVFVAQQFGEDTLRALYRGFSGGPLGVEETDAALRAAVGVDQRALVGLWSRWLADTVAS